MSLIPKHVKDIINNNLTNAKTPYYLLDIDEISNKYLKILNAWKKFFDNTLVAYSYKTNSIPILTETLRNLGSGAEVVSGLELFHAMEDKIESNKIYFNGPVKEKNDLKIALRNKVNILIDSLEEFEILLDLILNMEVKPRIIPRLAVVTKNNTISRFGLTIEEYQYVCKKLNQYDYEVKGLSFHVGSNNNTPQKYIEALSKFNDLIDDLLKNSKNNITLDIGGGFASNSSYKGVTPIETEKFAESVYNYFKSRNIDTNKINIVLEPGRSLVEDYGYLITKVKVKKRRNEEILLITDAGSHLIHSIASRYHPCEFVKNNGIKMQNYVVYGLNCFEYDILSKGLIGAIDMGVDDLIIIGHVGGYDIPLEATWTQPKSEIWANLNNDCYLVRTAQQFKDIRLNYSK